MLSTKKLKTLGSLAFALVANIAVSQAASAGETKVATANLSNNSGSFWTSSSSNCSWTGWTWVSGAKINQLYCGSLRVVSTSWSPYGCGAQKVTNDSNYRVATGNNNTNCSATVYQQSTSTPTPTPTPLPESGEIDLSTCTIGSEDINGAPFVDERTYECVDFGIVATLVWAPSYNLCLAHPKNTSTYSYEITGDCGTIDKIVWTQK